MNKPVIWVNQITQLVWELNNDEGSVMSAVRLTKAESVNERVGERRPTSKISVLCFHTCGAVTTRTDSTSRCTSVQHKQIIQPNRHFFEMQKHTWIIHRKRTILIWILESRLRWLLMKVSAVLTINTIPTGIKSTWCRPFTGMSRSWHCRFDSIMFWYANYFAIWKINGSSGSNFRRKKIQSCFFGLYFEQVPFLRAQSLQCIVGMSDTKRSRFVLFVIGTTRTSP